MDGVELKTSASSRHARPIEARPFRFLRERHEGIVMKGFQLTRQSQSETQGFCLLLLVADAEFEFGFAVLGHPGDFGQFDADAGQARAGAERVGNHQRGEKRDGRDGEDGGGRHEDRGQ